MEFRMPIMLMESNVTNRKKSFIDLEAKFIIYCATWNDYILRILLFGYALDCCYTYQLLDFLSSS